MTKNVLMTDLRAQLKSFASTKAMVLLCLLVLNVVGVKAQIMTPYVIWCENNGNGTLYFTSSEESLAAGDTYDGKTITQVWSGEDVTNSGEVPKWVADETIAQTMWDHCKQIAIDESFQNVKPTSLRAWFSNLKNLTTIEGLQYLNTSQVTTMMWMFYSCVKLATIDVTTFNTSKVTDMSQMFSDCNTLTSLNLNSFDVSNVTTFDGMFQGCSSLTTIYCNADWSTANQARSTNMFFGCSKLKGGKGTTFSDNNMGITYARPDADGTPGYFTNQDVAYAIWCEGNNTLYFTYGSENYHAGGTYDGQTITKVWADGAVTNSGIEPQWDTATEQYLVNECTRVVFDEHFSSVRPKSTARWFTQFESLTSIEGIEYLNTSKVTNMTTMFAACKSLESLDLSHFDTSNVTNMSRMFFGCLALASIDVNYFNTSNVTNMSLMFDFCQSLTILDLSSFNTANVKAMNNMFSSCAGLTTLDLSGFTTDHVVNTWEMFSDCKNLTTIYCNNDWSIAEGSSSMMFYKCGKLFGGNGTVYDSNHIDIEYARIDREGTPGYFTKNSYAIWLEKGKALFFTASGTYVAGDTYKGQTITKVWSGDAVTNSGTQPQWIVDAGDVLKEKCTRVVFDESFSSVWPKSTSGWFATMENLTMIDGIENLNTSNVTNMAEMFSDCSSLTSLDLSNFNTENVTNMEKMFFSCSALTSVDLSEFTTEKVTSSHEMFRNCTNLTTIYCYNDWNLPNNMYNTMLFYDCNKLVGGNGTAYSTTHNYGKEYASVDREGTPGYFTKSPNVIWCKESNTLYFIVPASGTYATGDIYNGQTITKVWRGDKVLNNTSNNNSDFWSYNHSTGINIHYEKVVIDPSFSSARPISTRQWFQSEKITSIEGLEYLNTSEVTNMFSMFLGCRSLTSLDLSNFDTGKVTNMSGMFAGCNNLETIYVCSNWNTDKVTVSDDMFNGCRKLVGGNGTAYDSNHIDKEYARIDCEGTPGYFTKKPYAIWCEGNSTLYFTNPEAGSYAVGDTYDKQTITKVWRVNLEVGDQERAPWDTATEQYLVNGCTRVVFDENFSSVRPKSTVRWFTQFENLTSIEGVEYLNTSKVTNMKMMFAACKSLESLDLSHFDTSNVTNMDLMFNACISLTSLDLSSFNTANVTTMQSMFSSCSELTSLDLSGFTTDLVVNSYEIFAYCKKLTTIYCNNDWNLSDNSENTLLFDDCEKLVGGNGTAYSSFQRYDKECARVDRPGTQGYFTTHNTFDYTISDAMVGTLYLDYPVYVPSDEDYFNAYYVKSISETGTIHLKAMKDVIPAYTGVIIFGNEGSYKLIKNSGEVTAIEGNMLKGVLEDTSVADLQDENGSDIYILSRGMDKGSYINFYKAGGSIKTIPAHRAYLPYTSSNNVKELSVSFDDDEDATGISDIAGQSSINKGEIYNLAGQRVVAPTHGVYIVNGKKVFIR